MKPHGLIACILACLLLSNADVVDSPGSVTSDLYNQVPSLAEGGANSKTHRNDSSTSVEAACKAAQFALGPDVVEIAPVNQTVVHENWYVTVTLFA